MSDNPNVIIREDRPAALTIAHLTPQAEPESVLSDAEIAAQRSDPAQGVIVVSLSAKADTWLVREPSIRRIYKLTTDEWSQLDADPRAMLVAHFAPMPRVMFVPWIEAKLLVSAGFSHAVIADSPTELSECAVVWPHFAFVPSSCGSVVEKRSTVHIARYGGPLHDRDSQLALMAFARTRTSPATCTVTGAFDDAEAEVLERVALQYAMSDRVFIHPRSTHAINAETVIALRDDRDEPIDPHVVGAVERGCSLITLGWPEERACFSHAHFLAPLNPPLSVANLSPEGRSSFLAAHRGAVFSELEAVLSADLRSTKLKPAPSLAAALLSPTRETPPHYLPMPSTLGPLPLEPHTKKPLRQLVANPSAPADPRWLARALKLGLLK